MVQQTSRLGAVGLAALLVFSVVAMVAAPAMGATVDTEATVTGTQSDLTSSTTVSDYNGTDPGTLAFEANVTTQNDSEVHVIADGIRIHKFSNDELTETGSVDTGTDGVDDAWYKRLNSSQMNTALQKVPMRSGENKTVTVRAIDNATLDRQNRTYADANITVDNTAGRIIVRGGAGTMNLESIGAGPLGIQTLFGTNDIATLEEDGVAINGSGTTMTLSLTEEGDNTSVADRFGGPVSDSASDGTVVPMQLWVNGNPHKVYYGSAPSGVDSSDTYGVYNPETNEVDITFGDQYDSEDTVDVRVVGGQDFGILTKAMNFWVAGVPFVGGFLVLFGSIRHTRRRTDE